MKNIDTIGSYKAPNGQNVEFPVTYPQFENLQDAVSFAGGEGEALKLIQRMVKVDAGNVAREKAKVANGHSSRKPQTEEQKAAAKAERASSKALLEALKARGIKSVEELSQL